MKVSVIIVTKNRAEFIRDTLEGLKYLNYNDFEVIVVDAGSTDGTIDIVKEYNVRLYTTHIYNIGVQRNIGIKQASGEIIAFIDDDAIPEPDWLNQIVEAYNDPSVAAAGGKVYNDIGDGFQFCYGAVDKWGRTIGNFDTPYNFNSPQGPYYNVNIGTNASFRRDVLISVGAFDEEIEYFHDESDVCVRIIQQGHRVVQLDNAFVHHKFARSVRRKANKKVINFDSIVKNTVYFAIKNSKGTALYKRLIAPFWFEKQKFRNLIWLRRDREYSIKRYLWKNLTLINSFIKGYFRGFFRPRKLIQNYKYYPENFKTYKMENLSEKKLNIVLISQGYPPNQTDGISRYNSVLAKELAKMGHHVFVITKRKEESEAIDYEKNVWIYNHNPKKFYSAISEFEKLNQISAHCKSVYKRVEQLNKKNKIDIILSPVFDVEGYLLELKKIAPVIVTLMSPLKKVVETQWFNSYHESFEIIYEMEKSSILMADGVMSISNAIKDTFHKYYDINWIDYEKKKPAIVLPLGVDEDLFKNVQKIKSDKSVNILFVGRLERRKGIDLLLSIIPNILKRFDNVEFTIVGNDKILHENKINYKEEFLKIHKGKDYLSRVKFYGYVSDEELARLYSECDIFVAPSRYESFGIIFIEAMANGKPVVGTNVGGIPEIIMNGENGFLFDNESTKDLQEKLEVLIQNKEMRLRMGQKGLEILKNKFSANLMAKNFIELVYKVKTN